MVQAKKKDENSDYFTINDYVLDANQLNKSITCTILDIDTYGYVTLKFNTDMIIP